MPDAPAALSPTGQWLALLREALADGSFLRLVLAKPRGGGAQDGPLKVSARLLQLKDQVVFSVVETWPTRDLTRHLPIDAAPGVVGDGLASRFNHAHLFTAGEDIQLLVGKRGRQTLLRDKRRSVGNGNGAKADPTDGFAEAPTVGRDGTGPGHAAATAPALAAHDRVKRRPIAFDRPYLQCLGVTDAQHRLVPAMARKWKQINKFVEVLDHALSETSLAGRAVDGSPIEVLDFGSGKGYLTFATHDHLRHTLGLDVKVSGVDLKADMIALCNRAAAQVGAEGLVFELGDVASRAPQRADVMIALHACDTATDHAIHAGLRAGAAIIMCSPCCHKELRPQLLSPHPLRPILKHGVHLGQQAEMLTDGLRALLLEACGYDTQVFEFISPEQTSKNKMILAVKRETAGGRAGPEAAATIWQQVAELKAFYGIQAQCLERLLQADRAAAASGDPAAGPTAAPAINCTAPT